MTQWTERVPVARDIGQVVDLDAERLRRLKRLAAQPHIAEAKAAIDEGRNHLDHKILQWKASRGA